MIPSRHNLPVEEYTERISEIAALMDEFRLAEASLEVDGFRVAFRKRPTAPPPSVSASAEGESNGVHHPEPVAAPAPVPERPQGTPISSPMTGIYYGSPSPTSPPFVKEGETVSAGQVVGLIEAMKVYSEIPADISGTVVEIVAQSGRLVQHGDVLLYIDPL